MSPEAPTLALLLDSPLQSWGGSSRFQRRGAGSHPTKSGIVAILACARGIDKNAPDEERQLAPLAAFLLTTARLPRIQRDWKNQPRLAKDGGILIHSTTRMTDYHTIGGGYDEKREKLNIPRKASGGTFGTVQTWRDYLQDTRFAVFLQGDPVELESCIQELANPKWGLWLGRKCCPPSVPIIGRVHPDSSAAWAWILEKAGFPPETPPSTFERHMEMPPSGGSGDFTLLDQPVSFARREFHSRAVRRLIPGELP